MKLVPGLGLSDGELLYFTRTQAIWIATVIYFDCALYLLLGCLCLYNIYKFMWKQQKWKNVPLVFFYGTAVLNICVKFIKLLFYMSLMVDKMKLRSHTTFTVTIAIGMYEILMVFELCLRIDESVSFFKHLANRGNNSISNEELEEECSKLEKQRKKVKTQIKVLRISIVTAVILLIVGAFAVPLILGAVNPRYEEDLNYTREKKVRAAIFLV